MDPPRRPDRGRSTLGKVLPSIKASARKRRVQAVSSRHAPVQRHPVKMETSRLAGTPALRGCELVLAHIQCRCPALQDATIRAHLKPGSQAVAPPRTATLATADSLRGISGLIELRPCANVLAFRRGSKSIMILEFTRAT